MLPRQKLQGVPLILFMALSARATTLRVPADYPTIQAGINAAFFDFDSVLVADGIYTGPGNRGLTFHGRPITVRSESLDPSACVIDCEDADRGFEFTSGETEASVLEGFTITRGSALMDGGGAIVCSGSRPTIRDCRFLGNRAAYGGAIACCSNPTFLRCRFEQNEALPNGVGGCGVSGGGSAVYAAFNGAYFVDCLFVGNRGPPGLGACLIQGTAILTGCSFIDNESGGLVRVFDGFLQLTSCVFRGNHEIALYSDGSPEVSSCVFVQNEGRLACSGGMRLRNTIVAFNTGGIFCYATPTASCCDLFGNAGGDWVSCLAGQNGINGNFSADPLFCDLAAGDLTLNGASPCAPDHTPDNCGLIGALPVGCGVVAVEPETWGRLKATFR